MTPPLKVLIFLQLQKFEQIKWSYLTFLNFGLKAEILLICERNVCGIEHTHMFRKDNFLEKDNLNIIIIIMVYFEHP